MINEEIKWKAKFDVIINAGACAKLEKNEIVNSFVRQLGEDIRPQAEKRVNEIYDNFSLEQDDKIIAAYDKSIALLDNDGK